MADVIPPPTAPEPDANMVVPAVYVFTDCITSYRYHYYHSDLFHKVLYQRLKLCMFLSLVMRAQVRQHQKAKPTKSMPISMYANGLRLHQILKIISYATEDMRVKFSRVV